MKLKEMSSDPWSIFDSEQNKLSHNCLSQDLSTFVCACFSPWLTSDSDCAVTSHARVWSEGTAKN